MANPLKQLAGETAIYGMSSILARVVNFMLVPLYTNVLTRSDYGVVTEFMAYIAILQVVLVMGMETGCFRFASKEGNEPDKIFSNAFVMVTGLSLLFFGVVTLFSGNISAALGYEGFSNIVVYTGVILLIDCSTSVIFARLRYEHKALRFAIIKTLKIFTEVGVNLFLYLWFPKYAAAHPDTFFLNFVSAAPDYSYAIFAIFASCIVAMLLLLPEYHRLGLKIDVKLCKSLLVYSLPLMIAGLPGVMNDFLDRVLMRFLNADPAVWRADLGVYQAGVKIAVLMSLFVQMFRYAAEPFFFQREKDKDNKQLYSKVMTFFVLFCMLGFLGVMLYIDAIGLILGRDFRIGLAITPIMLMAYVVMGMMFNISIWYKLSGKTFYAVWITLAGLAVTLLVNIIFMPRFSYYAAAWGHLACNLVMMIISLILGNKHYPIPYNWKYIGGCIVFALAIFFVSKALPPMDFWPKMGTNTLLLMLYVVPVGYVVIRKKLWK
ncbi:MAG: oligosaccharide flippase family protein [Bacteroidales bacterium]|nr:oligosaccharide flippase family protein [Bacteroidales bacterium]